MAPLLHAIGLWVVRDALDVLDSQHLHQLLCHSSHKVAAVVRQYLLREAKVSKHLQEGIASRHCVHLPQWNCLHIPSGEVHHRQDETVASSSPR